MREIKFRAWIDGKMLYIGRGGPGSLGWDLDVSGLNTCSSDYVPFMQFTGLKDCNGKEIYEGDLVIHMEQDTVDYWRTGRVCEVLWSTAGFETGMSEHVPDSEYGYPEPERIKVIGNIYENPELKGKI